MVDVFMIVMICVLSVLLIITSIYLLAYYSHKDEPSSCISILCKIAVVIGMTLSWAQVLMLPLDVSNVHGGGAGINMQLFWFIVYISTAVFIGIILPALIFWYEADPDWNCWERFKYSFCYLIVTIIITLTILLVLYAFIGTAYIPVKSISCSISNVQNSDLITFRTNLGNDLCITEKTEFQIQVSFPIYLIGFMSFISWFLFSIYGGFGLAAIPMDCFYEFKNRPRKMNSDRIKQEEITIKSEAKSLMTLCEEAGSIEQEALKKTFFNKTRRNYNSLITKIKAGTYLIEKRFKMLEVQNLINDKMICHYYFLPFLGVILLIISFAWLLQILLYFIIIPDGKPIYPLINNLLVYMQENNASFVAVIFFSLFCLYLLLASIKGNLKLGVRFIFCCMSIHPMKKDKTYMNSFLFNTLLILLCSVSITQFCAAAFADYTAMTDIDLIFTIQIRYLVFFVYFFKYHIFEYALFGVALLSFIILLCRPRDNTVENIIAEQEKV